MGQVLSQVRDVRGGIVKFNASSAVTMYDFNATSRQPELRASCWVRCTSIPASGGTPTRDALNYIGQQYMRTDAQRTDPVCVPAQRGVRLDRRLRQRERPDGAEPTTRPRGATVHRSPDLRQHSGRYSAVLLHHQPAARPCRPGWCPFDPTNTRPDADRNPNLHMNTYGLTLGIEGHDLRCEPAADRQSVYLPADLAQSERRTAIRPRWTICGTRPSTAAGRMYTTTDVTGTVGEDPGDGRGSSQQIRLSRRGGGLQRQHARWRQHGLRFGCTPPAAGMAICSPSRSMSTPAVSATNTPLWSARDLLEVRDCRTRAQIATYDTTIAYRRMPFRWSDLPSAMRAQLSTIASAPTLDQRSGDAQFPARRSRARGRRLSHPRQHPGRCGQCRAGRGARRQSANTRSGYTVVS